MLKRIITVIIGLFLLTTFAFADAKDPDPAARPSDCKSKDVDVKGSGEPKKQHKTPSNCVFIEEPIGGRPGFDLFTVNCDETITGAEKCKYELWNGEVITPPAYGPVHAILSWEPGKEDQKGFSLFYNYVGLIYKYLSGIIVGVVILFIIIGGIQMTTSAGNEQGVTSGKDRIVRAIIGMIVWFLASLILYTINPTFFAFPI